MAAGSQTVVILGAGINGCALARELALNGLSVVVVDVGDVASGTTAYSSRLIHGGLRYLEYGDFALVRNRSPRRGRLLRLATAIRPPAGVVRADPHAAQRRLDFGLAISWPLGTAAPVWTRHGAGLAGIGPV